MFFTVTRIHSIYRFLGLSKTVVTPFLLVGGLFYFLGITDLLEIFSQEFGSLIHSLAMLFVAILLVYGLQYYHETLKKLEESKKRVRALWRMDDRLFSSTQAYRQGQEETQGEQNAS